MSKRFCCFSISVVIFYLILVTTAQAADPSLVGWWKLDEGAGMTAIDSSNNSNNGKINGSPTWLAGKLGGALQFNGTDSYINAPHIPLDNRSFTIALWLNPKALTGLYTFFSQGTGANNSLLHLRIGGSTPAGQAPVNGVRMGYWNNDLDSPTNILEIDTWHHLAFVYDYENRARRIYLDGVEQAGAQTSGVNPYIATTGETFLGSEQGTNNWFNGIMDDVRIYTKVLSEKEIVAVMTDTGKNGFAGNPSPTNKETDVARDVILSWTPGAYVKEQGGTHNVFFGTDFNDVNDATVSNPLEATVSAGQITDANTFNPGALEFGKTYYWRVDEVNVPAHKGQFKGQVWSFTSEKEALDLPFANIEKVTAKSSGTSQDANNTVNGYGIVDANFPDQHTNSIGSWASTGTDAPNNVWIQYDFDNQYRIHQMMVWNYNQNLLSAKGFKDVLVQYSEDGDTWIDMPGITKFEKAPGKPYYDVHDSNNIFDFNDVIVKSVRITALSNYGNKAYGLSEVRFTYIPVRARIPSPADGAQNVAFGTIFKWRKGREALTHKFYIGTDKDAVINGTVTPVSLNVNSYSPNISLESTYYWRVDEINTSLDPSVWKGNVWTFTTPSTILIDGFEKGYGNDTNTDAVFLTWQDAGILSTAGGSWMGRKSEPFLDVINHTGGHSAPMEYNNQSYSYSEVTADTSKLQNGSNWSLGNPGALVIWFMSDANDVNEPALDRLYVRIGSTKKVYPGPASDIRRTSWTKWEIPLAGISLGNVSTLTIGVERIGSTGSIGVIYLDDIMLTPASPAAAAKVNPGTNGLLAKYTMDDNVQDSSGHGLNGTLTGTANGGLSYVDSMSGFGKALVFDGNDDCVDLGKMEAFNFAGSFSVTLWAKASTWSTNWGNVMISNRGEATGGGWQIRRYTNNTVCFTTRGVSNDDTNSNFNVAIREWNNITCVYDSEAHTKSIYINGVLDRKVNLTGTVTKVTATTTKTFIGARSNSGNTGFDAGTFFKGMLDQVIIYDRALSAGEAAYLAAPTP